MSILKIILVPLSLILSLFVWLCAGLLSCSGFVFKLASGLLSLLAFAVLITYSLRKERHHPPYAGVSDQPDGTSHAGRVGAGQTARHEHRHEKLHS